MSLVYDALARSLFALVYADALLRPGARVDSPAWLRGRLAPDIPRTDPQKRPRIWIHAVSAGEMKTAELLAAAIRRRAPGAGIYVSTATEAGWARARAIAAADAAFIMPIDLTARLRAVFKALRPDSLVLAESELWPGLFSVAGERGVPIYVVNAFISERSFARHRRFPAVARATIARVAHAFAQDREVVDRWTALGADPSRVSLSGNLKLVPPANAGTSGAPDTVATRARTVTFGNVHPEELGVVRQALERLARHKTGLRVFLVPRHPDRFTPADIAEALGEDVAVVTDPREAPTGPGTVWVNAMGVLSGLYAQSAVGVVCGTFSSVGGHDLAEPFHYGAVSVFGPHTERQRAVHATLSAHHCALQVTDAQMLAEEIVHVLSDPDMRETHRQRFAGATRRAEDALKEIVDTLLG